MADAIDSLESTSQMLNEQINREDLLTWKYYFDPEMAIKVMDVLVQASVQPEVIQNVFEALGVSVPAKVRGDRPARDLNALERLPEPIILVGVVSEFMVFMGLLTFICSGVWIKWLFG